jgi:hypothetical protein
MSEETKEHEIEKLVDDIIKSPDFEALKRKATYLIKSSQTSEISQLKRKLEIVDSVLKQAQEDFDKQITELKEAFDTAHNTNIYLQKENEKLKAEPQAQSAEADSLGLYFERNKVAQPQQPTAREMLEALIEYYDNNKRWFLSSSRRSGVEYKGLTGIALLEFAEQWLKEKTKER